MSTHYQLDCRRLLCPMPVIRVQDKVTHCQPGDLVEACCTDPGTLVDIPAWCRIHGHTVLQASEKDDLYHILVQVGDA